MGDVIVIAELINRTAAMKSCIQNQQDKTNGIRAVGYEKIGGNGMGGTITTVAPVIGAGLRANAWNGDDAVISILGVKMIGRDHPPLIGTGRPKLSTMLFLKSGDGGI